MKENEQSIAPYLHLYLGCDVWYDGKILKLIRVDCESGISVLRINPDAHQTIHKPNNEFKLICKRPSDMTDEDAVELCKLQTPDKRHADVEVHDISHTDIWYTDGSKWYGDGVEEVNDLHVHFDALNPAQFAYLLFKGYWLFGNEYFDKGLIIDAKTIER